MANFTMEIREMMNQALINGVFTFDYEFYSDNLQDKESFEKLFISHFYFREIGFETPERFKMKLQAKLNLIMPYYRQLALTEWDNLKSIEQMMTSKNLTETTEHTQSIQGNNETQSNQTTASNGSNSTTSNTTQSSSSNASQSSTSNNDSKASNLADGVSQSSLTAGYLTSSGKTEQTDSIQSESTGNSNQSITGSETQSITGNTNQSITGNNEQQLSEKTTFTSKGDIGVQTPAYAITEWRKVIINLNQMIINECEDLFMKLY